MSAYLEAETHIDDAARGAKLEAIKSSHACEDGRVVVLDFAAIRTKIAHRWTSKREDVWTQIERAVQRHGGRDTLYCRLNQTEYLLAFSQHTGVIAQSLGFQILEDVFVHFLGQFSDQDLLVKTVHSLMDGEVVASQPLARKDLRDRPNVPAANTSTIHPAPPASPLTLYEGGRQLEVSLSFENVLNLRTDKFIGVRLCTTINDLDTGRMLNFKERNALSTRALLMIDVHVLDAVKALMAKRQDSAIFFAPLALQPVGGRRRGSRRSTG